MKFILVTLLFVFLSPFAWSQDAHVIEVNTPVKKVKLYLNGASVYRSTNVKLVEGENIIKVQGISRYIEEASIQFNLSQDVNLLSIATDKKHLSKESVFPELKQIHLDIEEINKKITTGKNRINAYMMESKLLFANLSIKSDQSNLSLEELAKAADFIHKRSFKINEEIAKISVKEEELNKQLDLLEKRKNAYRIKSSPLQTSIHITLESPKAMDCELNLNYLVQQAAWKPIYDVKAEDLEQPIRLIYKAKILNNTEIDWNKVEVSCSTSDPSRGITLPQMNSWVLSTRETRKYEYGLVDMRNEKSNQKMFSDSISVKKSKIPYREQIEINDLSREFFVAEAQDITSGRKPITIKLKEYNLPATYHHYCIPKKDKDVFLTAGITNWEQLQMINGQMNVYYKNTYIGQTHLNTQFIDDTLKLSLGRVQQVIVQRTKLIDQSKKRRLGSTIKETLSYEIVVKNNGQKSVSLDLKDQVPIANTDDIKINAVEISGAEHNENSGELSWLIKLEPGKTQKFIITFTVEYPKYQKIKLRYTRSINCPSF